VAGGHLCQKYWLPLIRAEIDLGQGRSSKAVDDLNLATTPIEFAIPPAMPVATLYPAYVRGQAYLAAGKREKALTEFQKFSGHSGLVANYPLGALARLGLAPRLFAHRRHSEGAPGYQEFFPALEGRGSRYPNLKKSQSRAR